MDNITKEAARRMANAALCLPQVELHQFITQLAEQVALPVTEEKLAQVTIADLKQLFVNQPEIQAALATETLERAQRCLGGETTTDPTAPTPEPCVEGELPGSLRVAVASNIGETLEGHFGTCLRFLIYQVNAEAFRLIEVRSTAATQTAEDKNAARVDLIRDCPVLYVQSVGGPAAAKIVNAGIHPVQFPQGGSAREALARLQTTLASPPLWLAKILGDSSAKQALEARFLKEAEV